MSGDDAALGAAAAAAAGGAGISLRVFEIFDSLQGEGYWTGVPMTFVRLAGCNAADLALACTRWCDTKDAWPVDAGEDLHIGAVVDRVPLPRLCLTGGEPLLQLRGVAELLEAAHEREIRVHVETNGMIDPAWPLAGVGAAVARPATAGAARVGAPACLEFDWVVVSPKPPDYRVSLGWEGLIDELKLVADESLDAATAERLAASHPGAFVFIQPVAGEPGDEPRAADACAASIERAIALVMSHPEWRLSLQTHKFLGIR